MTDMSDLLATINGLDLALFVLVWLFATLWLTKGGK